MVLGRRRAGQSWHAPWFVNEAGSQLLQVKEQCLRTGCCAPNSLQSQAVSTRGSCRARAAGLSLSARLALSPVFWELGRGLTSEYIG